jgi:alpha-maltose-1-phosphate synthase
MKVIYTAPTRAHHYQYASSLHAAGYLKAFVSGFPRISSKAKHYQFDGKLHHSDMVQMLYLLSLKSKFPEGFSNWLCFLSKKEQDYSCKKFINDADVFLFYNGSGLHTSKQAKKNNLLNIVEVVNSHLTYQENLLEEECRSINLSWYPSLKAERLRRLKEYEEADYILLPSEFVRRSFLLQGFAPEKLLKVPYGFKTYQQKENELSLDKNDNSFTVLYVGSISVRKGVRYLINAFKQLKHPQKKLFLVGPNANDGALKGLSLDDDIVCTGVLKGEDLDRIYKSADVFCLPSIEDGFGLVLGEALSYGLPIITTCNTGADEIITEGKEGFVVPIRNSQAILEKLQLLAGSPELFSEIRSNSIIKAKGLNGWEEAGKRLVNTLLEVYHRKQTA